MVLHETSSTQVGLVNCDMITESLLEPCIVDKQCKELGRSDAAVFSPKIIARRPTFFLILVCLSACFSMAINMIHFIIVNMVQQEIKVFVNESYSSRYAEELSERGMLTLWGFIVAAPMSVAAIGASSVSFFSEKFGRKTSLFLIHNVGSMTACLLCILAKPLGVFELLIAGRLTFGLSYGFALTLVGMYMTECSPPQFRSLVGSFIGFLGILMLSFFGVMCLPAVLGNEDTWQYIYLVPIVFGAVSLVSGLFLPESPKYTYIVKGDRIKAIKDIQRLHGADTEIDDVLKTYDKEKNQTIDKIAVSSGYDNSLRNILIRPHLRKGLTLGIAGVLVRALCGCEVVMVHGTGLIIDAFGLTSSYAQYLMLTIVFLQLIATMVTPMFIERCDGRPLILSLTLATIVSNIVYVVSIQCYNAFSYHVFAYVGAIALVMIQLLFLLGITPTGFILCSIVTPQEVRSKCVSISYTCFYLACFFQWFGFPIIYDLIGSNALLVISVLPCVLLFIYLYINMPLTRGIPVNEIIEKWMTKSDLELLEKLKIYPEWSREFKQPPC